jgi:hypothetical protein
MKKRMNAMMGFVRLRYPWEVEARHLLRQSERVKNDDVVWWRRDRGMNVSRIGRRGRRCGQDTEGDARQHPIHPIRKENWE